MKENLIDDEENAFGNNISIDMSQKISILPKKCVICEKDIIFDEALIIQIKCNHTFCAECWREYLNEIMSNCANKNNFNIYCPICHNIIDSFFIERIIDDDENLINKYRKYLEQKEHFLSGNYLCPEGGCKGYAKKTGKEYIKCNFNHEFCSKCFKKPHGKNPCELEIQPYLIKEKKKNREDFHNNIITIKEKIHNLIGEDTLNEDNEDKFKTQYEIQGNNILNDIDNNDDNININRQKYNTINKKNIIANIQSLDYIVKKNHN